MQPKPEPGRIDPERVIYASLLALAFNTVFSLVSKPLDGPLRAALFALGVSMPLLAGCLVAAIGRARHSPPLPPTRFGVVAGLVSCGLPVFAVGALLLHFGLEYLGSFAAASGVAVVAVRRM
jgi:hypothetical protein